MIARTGAGKKRIQHRIAAPFVRKHQVFIKRSFHRPRVRNAKNGVGPLDVVGNTKARFGFPMGRESVVEITTQSQIQRPVSFGDRILNIESKFLDVGVAVKCVKAAGRCRDTVIERWSWAGQVIAARARD